MAAANPVQSLQQEATCSICLEYYTDPVTTKCGHNFCRGCASACIGGAGTALTCPQCREVCRQGDLRVNRQLQSIVELVKQLSVHRERPPEEGLCAEQRQRPPGEDLCTEQQHRPPGEGLCAQHEERLKLFCKDDERLICPICNGHEAHTVHPIEKAAQEYKIKLREWLQTLRGELGVVLQSKLADDEDCKGMRNKLEAERRKIETEFQKLQELLKEQEQTLLRRLEEMDKKIAIVENANIVKVSAQVSSLEVLITEIEKKCEQPAQELLKDIRSTLNRCKVVMDQAPARNAKIYKVRVTLDEDTAHAQLALSEEGRRVRSTGKWQGRPGNPKRFTWYPGVLGRDGFSSGKHYWELQFLQEGGWTVGVIQESVSRKKKITLSPEMGAWTVHGSNGWYWANTFPESPLSPHQRPGKLGLYLDYEGGELSVYNADTMEALHTFTGATFNGRVYPFFCVEGSTDLRLV